MKAQIKPNMDNNRKRLADIIPLEKPFTVYVEGTRLCNMKCFYCMHSTRNDKDGSFKKLNYDVKNMPMEDFEKIVAELQTFPEGHIKRVVFSGLGEPLANPLLPDFVELISKNKIAERIEVITNGLMLNRKRAQRLIDAGITNINISIQGINAEQYAKTCGVNVQFDQLLDNLKFLYEIRKDAKIYIKIIDVAMQKKEDEETFYSIFGQYADNIFVEHLVQMQQQHDEIRDQVIPQKNMYGRVCNTDRKVCGQCFYFLQIGCDLDIFPCSIPGLRKSFSLGNLKEESILEIWNGKNRTAFLKDMLTFEKDKYSECRECLCYNVIDNDSEYLDKDAPELVKRFE